MSITTVSIVTYRTDRQELLACLDSLRCDEVKRIYIVDNGAERRIQNFVTNIPRVEYIPLRNPGYGAGHNVAIRRALAINADYHLVLNSDVRFEPEVLPRLIAVMNARRKIGQLQPRLVYPDGSRQPAVRMLPTPLDVFGRRFLPNFIFSGRNKRYTLQHLDPDVEHNIPYHQGSFMLLRTDALRCVGLFDERFFMYPEDIDLTRRIHRYYETIYYPSETVIHAHRAGSYHSKKLLAIHTWNMIRYFNKWGWWCDSERRRFNAPLRP